MAFHVRGLLKVNRKKHTPALSWRTRGSRSVLGVGLSFERGSVFELRLHRVARIAGLGDDLAIGTGVLSHFDSTKSISRHLRVRGRARFPHSGSSADSPRNALGAVETASAKAGSTSISPRFFRT